MLLASWYALTSDELRIVWSHFPERSVPDDSVFAKELPLLIIPVTRRKV
jgi:hypothetical protein